MLADRSNPLSVKPFASRNLAFLFKQRVGMPLLAREANGKVFCFAVDASEGFEIVRREKSLIGLPARQQRAHCGEAINSLGEQILYDLSCLFPPIIHNLL
jgi:hypothetical protein